MKNTINSMKHYVVLLCFISLAFLSNAQTNNNTERLSISAKGMYDQQNKQIKLRWLPMNFRSWEFGNQRNYTVRRFLVERKYKKIENPDEIAKSMREYTKVVQPFDVFDNASDLMQIAGQAIYHPEDFKVTGYDNNEIFKAYQTEKNTQSRMSMSLLAADQSEEVAEATALALTDKEEIEANCKYEYTISFSEMNDEEAQELRVGFVTVSTYEEKIVLPDFRLSSIVGDKRYELNWLAPESKDFSYTSFDIEISNSDSGPWIKVNALPFVFSPEKNDPKMHFEGTLQQNNVRYFFRVTAKNIFGINDIVSTPIQVVGKPLPMTETASIQSVTEANKGKLLIKWNFDAALQSKINGFEVWRSKTRDGDFAKINNALLAVSVRQFEDPTPLVSNYYTVVAKDKNGYDVTSVPQLAYAADESAPTKPVGVTGKADKTGKVTLTWTANTETDLKGYYVFQSNNKTGDYINISKIWTEETTFSIDVNIESLSEETFFKIAAIDYRENKSILSDPCTVKLPDMIPPTQPILVSIAALAGGVQLDFRQSESKDIDHHEIQRKGTDEATFSVVSTIPSGSTMTTYLDDKGKQMTEYDYRIVAFDDDNNWIASVEQHIKNIGDGYRPSVQRLVAFKDPYALQALIQSGTNTALQQTNIGGFIKLYWEYPEYFSIYDFQIFRKLNNSPAILVKSVDYDEALFKGGMTLNSPNGTVNLGNAPTTTTTKGNTVPVKGGTPTINPNWVFIGQKGGNNVYFDPATNTYQYIPISTNNNTGTNPNNPNATTGGTNNNGLIPQGIQNGYQVFYNPATGQYTKVPVSTSANNLTYVGTQKGYEEYIDKANDIYVWFPDTYATRLNQQDLTYQSTQGDYDTYAIQGAGKGITFIDAPTTSNPNLQSKGAYNKTHEMFYDSKSDIILIVPNGFSANNNTNTTNTGTNTGTNSGSNPPSNSTGKSFLVADDDYNTILSANGNLQSLEYQVLVRFTDGTSSRLSIAVKPF